MTTIEELDDIGQGMRVKWRKANNYFNSLAKDVFDVKKRFDAGEFPGHTFSGWLTIKAGLSEKFLMQQFVLFKRILAEEEREKAIQLTADADRAKRQAAAAEKERKRIARVEREAATAARRAAKAEQDRQKAEKQAQEKAAKEAEDERNRKLATAVSKERPSKVTAELRAEIKRRILAGQTPKKEELATMFGVGKNTVDTAVAQVKGELRVEQEKTGIVIPAAQRSRKKTDSRDTVTAIREKPTANGSEPKPQSQPKPPVNDTPTQTSDKLAEAIHTVLIRASGREKAANDARLGWIDDTEELAKLFGKARRLYPSDPEFGQWRKTHNLGNDAISEKDCTALVGMSKNLEATRIKLETSNSWSWRLIWQEMCLYSDNVVGVGFDDFPVIGSA